MSPPSRNRPVIRWLLKSAFFLIISAAALFISSGSLEWWQAWAYLGVLGLVQVLNALVLIPNRPELIAERSQFQEGTKSWDRPLVGIMAFFGPLAMCIVAGLDKRYGWSVPLQLSIVVFGLALILIGSLISLWAMASNEFFSGTVRIQTDREHHVVMDGPYCYIRHPGYLGGILYDFGALLALSSLWTFIPAGITLLVTLLRTAMEDRTLKEELDGYRDYSQKVCYRLVPPIW